MSLPTRQDYDLPAGASSTLEFTLADSNGLVNLSNDTVQLHVKDDKGSVTVLPKSNGPGQHSDPTHGTTQFKLTTADLTTGADVMTRWWYTVWRIPGDAPTESYPHIVGELRLTPVP